MASKIIIISLTLLVASTRSIPVLEHATTEMTEMVETREEMMARYRLPNNTIPRLYEISLEPEMDSKDFTWNGTSSIDFDVLEPTRNVTVHAYPNLVINQTYTEIIDSNGIKYKPIEHHRDNELEFLILEFDTELPVGNYTLNLMYHGIETGRIVGYYRALDSSIPERHVSLTHFEATTARQAFPCWDEPGFKARFSLSVKHPTNYTVLSNMPEIERIETEDGKFLTKFGTTPLMSAYLLTFFVSDYESISNEFGNVTVWANKNDLDKTRHILNTSQKVIDVMEDYTGLPFGFPRVGSVLVPRYSSTATEHWGLVSYFKDAIIYNPMVDTTSELDRINMLIAHELSHSWFGNLVSPRWWNDLWLNEAFAAYFQYYIMDTINGITNGLFVVRNNQESSFFLDIYDEHIPVQWTPVTTQEIRNVFRPVTYRKGSALVHMFRNVLTDEIFRDGIKKFLTKHSYKAADANDLMIAFQEAYDQSENFKTPLDVNKTMMSWLTQTGSPVLRVTRNYTTGDTEISQESSIKGDDLKKWWIPLNYATKTNPNFTSTVPALWISDNEKSVTIRGIDKNDWVIFNIQASGYYRIQYDNENWKRIIEYMNTDNYENIHILNRAQLLDDIYVIVEGESVENLQKFFNLMKYLSREVEYLPWRTAMSTIQNMYYTVKGTEIQEMFEKHIVGLMNKVVEKLGYETLDTDDHMTKLLKEKVIEWACVHRHSGCAEFASQRLLRCVENPVENRLHPDNKVGIFCAGLRQLNHTEAQKVAEWAIVNERTALLNTLGCTENHKVHEFVLAAMETNSTEYNPPTSILDSIMDSSGENFNFVVDYIAAKYNATSLLSPVVDDRMYAINVYPSRSIRTKAQLEKYKEVWIAVNGDKKNKNLQYDIERAEENLAHIEKQIAPLKTLLNNELLADNVINGEKIVSQ